jgi:hypothetical protein
MNKSTGSIPKSPRKGVAAVPPPSPPAAAKGTAASHSMSAKAVAPQSPPTAAKVNTPEPEDRLRTGTVAIHEIKNNAAKAELAMLAGWINENMPSDFARVSEATLVARVKEGGLVPLLLRTFFGDVPAVSEALGRVAAARAQRNAFEQVEAHNAALRACQAAGVKLVSIAGQDLAEGKQGTVLAVVVQLVREALMKRVRESSVLQQMGEESESSEVLLLRFVNAQLKSAGSSRVADNWTTAMQDSEVLAILLGQVAGVAEEQLDEVLRVADLTARAEALLQLAEAAGVRKFVTAQSIAGGKVRRQLLSNVFLHFTARTRKRTSCFVPIYSRGWLRDVAARAECRYRSFRSSLRKRSVSIARSCRRMRARCWGWGRAWKRFRPRLRS